MFAFLCCFMFLKFQFSTFLIIFNYELCFCLRFVVFLFFIIYILYQFSWKVGLVLSFSLFCTFCHHIISSFTPLISCFCSALLVPPPPPTFLSTFSPLFIPFISASSTRLPETLSKWWRFLTTAGPWESMWCRSVAGTAGKTQPPPLKGGGVQDCLCPKNLL